MVCKYCGKDIGNSLSCSYCNDGKLIEKDDNSEQKTSALKGNLKKTEFSQAFLRKSRIINLICKIVTGAVAFEWLLLSLAIVIVTCILMGGFAERGFMAFLLHVARVFFIPIMVVGLVPKIFDLISAFSLRRLVRKYNPSRNELFENRKLKGQYKIDEDKFNSYAWECIAFSMDAKVGNFIILKSFIDIFRYVLIAILGIIFIQLFYLNSCDAMFDLGAIFLFIVRPVPLILINSLIALVAVIPYIFTNIEDKQYMRLRDMYLLDMQHE